MTDRRATGRSVPELAPCSACGSAAELRHSEKEGPPSKEFWYVTVGCTSCRMETSRQMDASWLFEEGDADGMVADQWNRLRPPE